jgi:hypothetical protein
MTSAFCSAIAFRGLLLPDLVKLWSDEADRVFAASIPKGAAPAPKVPPRPATAPRAAQRAEAAPPRTTAAPIADDLPPPGPGEVQVRVQRSGYTTPNGLQCQRGQIMNLPREIATAAAQHGAVDFITPVPSIEIGAGDAATREITP